ncbi:MAG: TIGR03936 family radical SAM-associated protein [Oscillospiraceae bacterium]|nr:TIGR03936 family radical SAM-associated protein [Oscillospiraceae bacterium]
MFKVRLRYEKTSHARYISHLDLIRTMQRAFARARLPLAYSEGFNPHPYLSIARPLPVGVSSVCELLDFGLATSVAPSTLPGRISRVLPPGLCVTDAWPAARKFLEIAIACYDIDLTWEEPPPDGNADTLRAVFDGRPLPVAKKGKAGKTGKTGATGKTGTSGMTDKTVTAGKTGATEINAAALIGKVSLSSPEECRIAVHAWLAAGGSSLSPGQLLEAVRQAAGEGFLPWTNAHITRTALLDSAGCLFR